MCELCDGGCGVGGGCGEGCPAYNKDEEDQIGVFVSSVINKDYKLH